MARRGEGLGRGSLNYGKEGGGTREGLPKLWQGGERDWGGAP